MHDKLKRVCGHSYFPYNSHEVALIPLAGNNTAKNLVNKLNFDILTFFVNYTQWYPKVAQRNNKQEITTLNSREYYMKNTAIRKNHIPL